MRILGPADLEECAEIIKAGGVVAYPTDTVYGLGCDPFNAEAVNRLVAVKGERSKPLPVLVDGLGSAEGIAVFTETAMRLIKRFWPGALTLVLAKREALPDMVTLGGSVGVRCPDHDTALALIRLCGGHLIGTSANRTGAPPCMSASEVSAQIGEGLDAIVDTGRTAGIESTVVRPLDHAVEVLRRGAVPLEEIAKLVAVKG